MPAEKKKPELTQKEKDAIVAASIQPRFGGVVCAGEICPVQVYDGCFEKIDNVSAVNVDTGWCEQLIPAGDGKFETVDGKLATRCGVLCKPIYLVPISKEQPTTLDRG